MPKKYRHTPLQVFMDEAVDDAANGDKNESNTTEWVWKDDDKNQIK